MREDVLPYKSVLSALGRITCEEGIQVKFCVTGCYKSCCNSVPSIQKIKSYIAKKENTTVDKLSLSSVAIASSVSKVIASVMTYPHEFLFTQRRARDDSKPLIHTFEVKYMGTWQLPNLFFVSIVGKADIYSIPA
ncbi:hypothetical protein SLA2020_310960 [Shorea laevis]